MVDAVSTLPAVGLNSRRILAGLDEAGLGPVLGPLVVAGVALEGPAGQDPWRLLKKLVSRTGAKNKIRVADSKKVHQGAHKLAAIEKTALSFFGAFAGAVPATLRELLLRVGVDVARLSRCPWYHTLDLPLPCDGDRDAAILLAHRLQRELARVEVRLLQLSLRVVDVEEFNASIATTDNKSDTHFMAYGDVLAELFASADSAASQAGAAHIVADRCGGRWHYGGVLTRRWPGARVEVVAEREARSDYLVAMGERAIKLSFAEQAEDRAFPTALASCLAKYVREAMLRCLNAWFVARRPDLRPTAGYYNDGHRFLEDVRGMPDVPWDRLIRCR